ncbi:MAG TPA: hypothetical protein VF461_13615 [Gemmatimonadaceae bacterium]
MNESWIGMHARPTIAPLRPHTSTEELDELCPGREEIFACDFYVTGAEYGEIEPGGLRLGRILNVDHHAPVAHMEAEITSTMLAAQYLNAGGEVDPAASVVIHHTDCDSMLSSAMMLGILPPDPDLVNASVCADHTGAAHPVADLLQALDDGRGGTRTIEQYATSLRNLRALLNREPLEDEAVAALARRARRRAAAMALVDARSFDIDPERLVAFAVSEGSIDSAFFPAQLRHVAVIMVAHRRDDTRWTVKLRLGGRQVPGLTLHALGVTDWDPWFGGRWNAGSNGRGGGTSLRPRDYAERLRERVLEVAGKISGS